jgi:hypothetical protein
MEELVDSVGGIAASIGSITSANATANLHKHTVSPWANTNPERGTPACAFGITNRIDKLLIFYSTLLKG